MVIIRGPPGTQLVVPEAQYNPDARASKYSIYCCSRNGPIESLLVRGQSADAADATAGSGDAGPAAQPPEPVTATAAQSRVTVLEPPPKDLDFLINLKEDGRLNALFPPASGAAAAAIAQLPAAKRARVGVD